MDKVLDYVFPVIGVTLLIALLGGYFYLSAAPSPAMFDKSVLNDREYLSKNQELYADCHRTIEIGDFSIATITNKYFNQGVPISKLEPLEVQFKDKYKQQCEPLIKEYRQRFTQYVSHKKEAADASLSKLDKLLGNKAEVEAEPSPIFSLYQEYDPKSLQYPTNSNAKMLYTADDYTKFVEQSL